MHDRACLKSRSPLHRQVRRELLDAIQTNMQKLALFATNKGHDPNVVFKDAKLILPDSKLFDLDDRHAAPLSVDDDFQCIHATVLENGPQVLNLAGFALSGDASGYHQATGAHDSVSR